MSAILSIAVLLICVLLLTVHFRDIKNTHNQNGDNFFGITDVGRMRTNNEDAFIAQKIGNYIAACVIDGVGGYEGGEVAAAIARDTILNYLSVPSGDITTMMREAFVVATEKIESAKKTNPRYDSMACVATLAMVDVAAKTFYYAHIGDTRLYLYRDNSLVKITKDQSFVGYLEGNNRISEEEAMQHPKRNEINNALGFEAQLNAADIETGSSPFLPGDLLLLCSDGLSDLVTSREMLEVLQNSEPLQVKGKILVQRANERGGKDNITIVLVRNHRKPVVQKALKPTATQEVKKNIAPNVPSPEPPKPTQRRKKNGLTIGLGILCLLLAAAVAVLIFQRSSIQNNKVSASTTEERPTEELLLQQALDTAASGIFSISDSSTTLPLALNGPLWIRSDTMRINGNGMRFLKSSSFNGPAVAVGDSCRYVLLENMSFENFDIAVQVPNKSLHLKNVRFVECRVPVQVQLQLPNTAPVNGSIANFFMSDTLHH